MDLNGARVLITGASRGIGEAIAREVASRGAIVAAVARDTARLEKLQATIGGTIHPTDLFDPRQVATLIGRVEDEAGPIDVLVNNAGVDTTEEFTRQDPDEITRTFELNLVTPVRLTRDALPRMERRGRGHIVNISSMAGATGCGGMTVYASSKAGLTHFGDVLSLELKKSPVHLTTVQLGPIPTDMLASVKSHEPTDKSFKRFYHLGLVTDVDPEVVATHVADAIEKQRAFVRLPKRMAVFPALVNVPNRFVRALLVGVKQR